jgi:hypothetical protein
VKTWFQILLSNSTCTATERLTEAVETELAEYFHEEKSSAEFGDFRGKLAGLTGGGPEPVESS